MNYLIKNAKVVDANSPHNNKRVDILVEQDTITQIGANIKTDKNVKVIEQENLHASPGWFDMQANFCDPGFEHREDLQSGMQAAAQGGFTGVCIMPNTNPPMHGKSQIEYVVNACKNNLVDVYPAGCLTHNSDGKEMTEMFDMKQAGAIAFTDYKNSIKDSGLLVRLLQYAENTNSLIITHCEDKGLTAGGQMNEGEAATQLGLKGIPALAEELMVQRNINLLAYAGGKMHVPTISSKQSADYIKQAKNKNLNITSGIAAHQLLLNDNALAEFDTNLKVTPPLRDKSEVENLKRAVINDAIDVIVSDHCPEEIENKDVEFDHAAFGIIALETAYAVANTALHGKIEQEKLIEKLSTNPRKILGLDAPALKAGEKANITLFNPDVKWEFTQRHIVSKSKNTPFINYSFIGKAIAVINNGKMIMCK
ncbi:MAG TPA: dihydroorotase [Bacteroidia bacterium]|nr:dihydroorotase [Bacteroidia bacterium]